jgi:hypothetical protein
MKNATVDELAAPVREADQSGIRCLYLLVDCADLESPRSASAVSAWSISASRWSGWIPMRSRIRPPKGRVAETVGKLAKQGKPN